MKIFENGIDFVFCELNVFVGIKLSKFFEFFFLLFEFFKDWVLLLEYVCVDDMIDEVVFFFFLDLEMFDFRFVFLVLFWLLVLVIMEVSEVLKLRGIEDECLIFGE